MLAIAEPTSMAGSAMTALAQSMIPASWFLLGKDVERVEIAMANRRLSRLRRSMIVQPGKAGFAGVSLT
jgi:hypothetical protein